MAGSDAGIDISNSAVEQVPANVEKTNTKPSARVKSPRRKFTLITITLLLNILHWASFVCLFTSIYRIAATPNDKTSIPSEVLTILAVRLAARALQDNDKLIYLGDRNHILHVPTYRDFAEAKEMDA